jgi:hypothetical protein
LIIDRYGQLNDIIKHSKRTTIEFLRTFVTYNTLKKETRNHSAAAEINGAILKSQTSRNNQKLNKMKKQLLLLLIVFFTITAAGQDSIPNGNFESWNTGTFNYPENYPYTSNSEAFFRYDIPFNVVKTTDVYHGTYAVEISSISSATDTPFGYIVNTNPNNGDPSSWTGGVPYSQMPVGMRGYYKYNVEAADSGTIIVAFSKEGINIGTYIHKVSGIHDTYALFNFTFNPALSLSPDSVAIAAASSDVMVSDNGVPGSILMLDSLSFTGVTSQPTLMNGDFELWQNKTLYNPANWFNNGGNDQGDGVNRTDDAAAGNYALELKTYLESNNDISEARSGQVSTGYWVNSCNCMKGGTPFSNQIDTLTFYYKYAPSGNDSANISLNFKNNGADIHGDGMTLHATATYQYMEIPFNTLQTPDSVIVQIASSDWQNTALSFVGSDLKIDDLRFKSQPLPTGTINYENDINLIIFPNPSNGRFLIQGLQSGVQRLEVYSVTGEKIYTISKSNPQATNEIDLSKFHKGVYFVKIYDGVKNYTKKVIIQ